MTSATSTRPDFPPVVYLPTSSSPEGELQVEFRHLAGGRLGLFAYSAIDRLHDWYRPDAPWLLVSVEDLQRIFDVVPYDALYLDARFSTEEHA